MKSILHLRPLFLGTALLLGACAGTPGAPWARVSGDYTGATVNRFPVTITSVDGRMLTRKSVVVEPGTHTFTMIPDKPSRFRTLVEGKLELDVEPCRHYVLAAQFENSTTERWQPVVDRVLDLPDCQAATGP